MTRNAATTTADRTVEAVARELESRGIGGMPVVDDKGSLIGMVTEYDIISKRGRTVGNVMSRGIIVVQEQTPVSELVELMGLHGVRQLPVERDGKLVGLVTRTELMRLFARTWWQCASCAATEPGITRPPVCSQCGADTLDLLETG